MTSIISCCSATARRCRTGTCSTSSGSAPNAETRSARARAGRFAIGVGPITLRDHSELGLAAHPAGDLGVLALGALEVLEVLLERAFVELREELRLHAEVKPADVVDQLTFIHGGFTFNSWPRSARADVASPIACGPN